MSIENADHLKQQEVRLTQKIKELADFINSDDAIIEARKEKHASRVDGVVKIFIERVLAGEEEAAHNLIRTFSKTLRPKAQISEEAEQFWVDTIVQSRKELEDVFKPEEEKVAAVEETPEVLAPVELAVENKEPPEEIPRPPAIPEPPTATYEFTDDTKDEEPDAKIAAATKPKVAKAKRTKKSMTTPKAPTAPKINKPADLNDEALAKELRGRQADETIKTMKKGDVFSFMGAEAKVIGFDKKTKRVKLETRLGEKIYTKEEFLEICGLLNKDTKLNTYVPKVKVLSEKAQAYQKEKARVQLEEKIEGLEKKVKDKMREAEILDQDAKINEIHLKAIRDEIEAIEKMEREIAQEEENAELATTMAKAREIRSTVPLSTAPVKATESLVKYEAPNKTQLKWLNDEELIQNKKLVEERIEEINKKTYTVQDLRDVGKERDAIEYARRMHKLQKGENNKEYTILTDKLEVAQKIYSTIEKKLRSTA